MNERLLILLSFIQYRWFSRFTTLRALRQHQRRLLKRQLAFVKAKSPFYRNKSSLPIMDKNTFMEQFEAVNTVQITRKSALDFALACEQTREFSKKLRGVTVGLSSGTSGNRGIFLVSDRERALWAGAMLAKTLPKGHLWGVRIAFFMRANSELYQTIQSPFIEFRFFDMLGDMEAALGALGAYQPTILVAPPSCLLQIAKWNRSGQINPRKVISIAEVLEDTDATTIRKAFGISVVHQVYQCTEGFLGTTCEYGTLHLNEDLIKVEKEYLDDRRFIPIITDLKRRAQPIIRYRLNDILVEKAQSCPCGSVFTALEEIEGRQDDVFEFAGATGTVAVYPDFIRRCLLLVEEVGEYRVQQLSASEVAILADNLSEESKRQITNQFQNLARTSHFIMPDLIFKPYEYNSSRKLKRVEKLC